MSSQENNANTVHSQVNDSKTADILLVNTGVPEELRLSVQNTYFEQEVRELSSHKGRLNPIEVLSAISRSKGVLIKAPDFEKALELAIVNSSKSTEENAQSDHAIVKLGRSFKEAIETFQIKREMKQILLVWKTRAILEKRLTS